METAGATRQLLQHSGDATRGNGVSYYSLFESILVVIS